MIAFAFAYSAVSTMLVYFNSRKANHEVVESAHLTSSSQPARVHFLCHLP